MSVLCNRNVDRLSFESTFVHHLSTLGHLSRSQPMTIMTTTTRIRARPGAREPRGSSKAPAGRRGHEPKGGLPTEGVGPPGGSIGVRRGFRHTPGGRLAYGGVAGVSPAGEGRPGARRAKGGGGHPSPFFCSDPRPPPRSTPLSKRHPQGCSVPWINLHDLIHHSPIDQFIHLDHGRLEELQLFHGA